MFTISIPPQRTLSLLLMTQPCCCSESLEVAKRDLHGQGWGESRAGERWQSKVPHQHSAYLSSSTQ